MEFLNTLRKEPLKALKVGGIVLVGLLLVLIAIQILGATLRPVMQQFGVTGMTAPSISMGGGWGGYASDGDAAYDYAYTKGEYGMMPELSARNAASSLPPRPSPQTTGDDAEEYEVTQYSASIETRDTEESCSSVEELKSRADVIFESANTHDRGCDFTFKVKHESVQEVLGIIEAMDPKELSENTYTIKAQVEDFTSEVEVLEKKRASIDATLASALDAYEEITQLATNTQNAEALARIIDSRIGIIERLTQERININEQLDRLARAKAEQLDRLEYTYFYVNVYENKFIDGEGLGDSWKEGLKGLIRDLNKVVQDLTIGLVLLLALIAQWALYALIVLLVAKYGWKIAKNIWHR